MASGTHCNSPPYILNTPAGSGQQLKKMGGTRGKRHGAAKGESGMAQECEMGPRTSRPGLGLFKSFLVEAKGPTNNIRTDRRRGSAADRPSARPRQAAHPVFLLAAMLPVVAQVHNSLSQLFASCNSPPRATATALITCPLVGTGVHLVTLELRLRPWWFRRTCRNHVHDGSRWTRPCPPLAACVQHKSVEPLLAPPRGRGG